MKDGQGGKMMAASTGIQLAQGIRQQIEELKKACAGIDEETAARAPADRWSPKEILSHLCGPDGSGHLPILRAYFAEETPTIEIDPGNPFFTEARRRMSVAQLLAAVEEEYECIARFAEGLSADQLERRARVPKLKESPLGEYPTLESLASGLGEFHLQFHINHLREILQALGRSST
jgi:hypothetical protein